MLLSEIKNIRTKGALHFDLTQPKGISHYFNGSQQTKAWIKHSTPNIVHRQTDLMSEDFKGPVSWFLIACYKLKNPYLPNVLSLSKVTYGDGSCHLKNTMERLYPCSSVPLEQLLAITKKMFGMCPDYLDDARVVHDFVIQQLDELSYTKNFNSHMDPLFVKAMHLILKILDKHGGTFDVNHSNIMYRKVGENYQLVLMDPVSA